MVRPLRSLLLAALLGPLLLAAPAPGQDSPRFDQAGLRELSEEVEALQIAYAALLAEPGRNAEGGLNAAQRGRVARVHRALQVRTRILRRPGKAGDQLHRRLDAERAELVRPLWLAVGLLTQRGRHVDSGEVREVLERWMLNGLEPASNAESATDAESAPPLPDLEELTTRVWILRLARKAHASRGTEPSVRVIDSALRYADLRLEGAPWSEQAVALSRVVPPERLARVVELAAERFDEAGEARRAQICRRLVRFYRGEPQVEEPPPTSDERELTEEEEHDLRVAVAAREAHLLAGEMAGAALLDELAQDFRAAGTTKLSSGQIAALLARAAELHREHGFPRQAESAEQAIEELLGTEAPLDALRRRVERLEAELEALRPRRR